MIEPDIITLCQRHGDDLRSINIKIDKIDELLRGTTDKAGFSYRLTTVEKFVGVIVRAIWIIIGTVLTASTTAIVYWSIFHSKPPI
jgi:hypothetical protein